jgi:hypothetical protein
MILDTRNVKSLNFGADSKDEMIIRNRLARHFTSDFGVVYSAVTRECLRHRFNNVFLAHL